MSGWGPHLHPHIDSTVRNLAFGGATTESFIDGGSWADVMAEVESGDTVLIQFGHNDQKVPHLDPRGGYSSRLRKMVTDARAGGAAVVLCTPVERRWFESETVIATHGDYPNAVRDLAHELDVPLIDLTAFTTWLYADMGAVASRELLMHFAAGEHPNWPEGLADDTHFHERGARRIAAFVEQSLHSIERQGGDKPAKGSPVVS